jgi:hypothetical protein
MPESAGSERQSNRVVERIVETPPTKVIQLERVKVSLWHRSAVAAAIADGRKLAESASA